MEAVGRDEAVELGQLQRAGRSRRRASSYSTSGKRALRPPSAFARSAPRVAVDRDDPPAGPEQVGECQRERTLPRPRCRPTSRPARRPLGAARRDPRGPPAYPVLWRPGRHAVDGQLDEPEDAFALRVVRRHRAQAGQQPDLELRQRVDVRVAQRDRPLEDRRPVEQPLAPGDPRRAARRSGGTRSRSRPSGGRRRRRVASAAYRRATPMSALARLISALSKRLDRNGQSRTSRAERVHARPRRGRARYASSACPSPYQPGRLMRACDQAKVHGIARSESIVGRLVAAPAARPAATRAGGRTARGSA